MTDHAFELRFYANNNHNVDDLKLNAAADYIEQLEKERDTLVEAVKSVIPDYYCQCGHPRCRIETTRKELEDALPKGANQ